MDGPLEVSDGELSEDEILDALQDGRRIVVRFRTMGIPMRVVLRYDGETYYCDTPLTLHRHESERAMRECIRDQGYATDTGDV